tara:strand:+ start:128 stop:448 length:321 start_codon:yes stop_codon:yes gene_type:complete
MRKHAELIKQWAQDETAEVECREVADDPWEPVPTPWWNPELTYRIKPKAKKKVEMWQWLCKDNSAHPTYRASDLFYKNFDDARRVLDGPTRTAVMRIEGSRIEVEE